jgi:AcrR family transcriptional regulator
MSTTQERIIEAATRSFVRDGVLVSRLEDIRREANVSVGAVYHHFPDKEALHAEAWIRALADYQTGFLETLANTAGAESGVKGAVDYHLRWVTANRDSAALLQSSRPSGPRAAEPLAEQNRDFFKQVLRWWRIHAGYGAVRDLDPDLLHALWLGPAEEYCRHWVAGHNRKMPSASARELAAAAWAALKGTESP